MSVILNLHQAQQLLEFFGGEDASVTVSKLHNHAHSGPGVYAWLTEHPDEGSIKLDEEPGTDGVGIPEDGQQHE
jgi:hypothetical protein